MRASLLLPLLPVALVAATTPEVRHGHHHIEPPDENGVGLEHDVATPAIPTSPVSSASAAAPSHTHEAPSNPPDAHRHNSHAPVKEFLDDVELHNWHDFPPTYMDADFRLTKDSVIFGEEFPEDWDPETVASHPGMIFAHVGCMIMAYFVLLPLGR